jgi:hypothetical protein
MALVRMVNGIADSSQKGRVAASVASLAAAAGAWEKRKGGQIMSSAEEKVLLSLSKSPGSSMSGFALAVPGSPASATLLAPPCDLPPTVAGAV